MNGGSAAHRQRFRRIAKLVIALLAAMEVVVAVGTMYIGVTVVGVALLIGMPIIAIYLAYLIQSFATSP